ncbi:MAG: PDZ domain-containing protein [Chthoniobacterales bacterium]
MNAPFVRTHELVTKYHAAPESVIGWGVGGAARGRPVRFGSLRLGGFDIVGIAGDLFTSDKGGFTNPNQAGNLGGGVLHRFAVAFDYANKKMYLVPNADFGKADAFDRSGLWLLADGDALKVSSVAKDSAAERAGMHENDRIISIGEQAVKERTLAEWRQRLRELPAGTKLEIRFERESKPRSAELVLADRIPPTFMP